MVSTPISPPVAPPGVPPWKSVISVPSSVKLFCSTRAPPTLMRAP
jgi:hypothetical protein